MTAIADWFLETLIIWIWLALPLSVLAPSILLYQSKPKD